MGASREGIRHAIGLQQAMRGLEVHPSRLQIAMEPPSNEAVRAAVEAGLGATAISASVVAPSIEAGLLHHVPTRLPPREFHVLRHKQRYKSRIADALLASLEGSGKARSRR